MEENPWGERLERIISDGDAGLDAALALNYPETPHQVCVFHKVKNLVGDLADKSCKGSIQAEAGRIFEAQTRSEAVARRGRLKRQTMARRKARNTGRPEPAEGAETLA